MNEKVIILLLVLLHHAMANNILKIVKKGKLFNTTEFVMKRFTPYQDLSYLHVCHVVSPQILYEVLGSIFLDANSNLVHIKNVSINKLTDFKRDIFKIHADAAFLKEENMETKSKFYSLNANYENQVEDLIEKLEQWRNNNSTETVTTANNRTVELKTDDYVKTIDMVNQLFYNAPANLRIADKCLNDIDPYEDPTLQDYNGQTFKKLSAFTKQSQILAKKYSLSSWKDDNGYITTTDKKKSFRKPKLGDESHRNLNVFQFYSKSKHRDQVSTKNGQRMFTNKSAKLYY